MGLGGADWRVSPGEPASLYAGRLVQVQLPLPLGEGEVARGQLAALALGRWVEEDELEKDDC